MHGGPKTIGERLAASRVNRGLSLSEAADAIGHSTDYLGHLESGLESASRAVLEELARLYGCPIEEMLSKEEG